MKKLVKALLMIGSAWLIILGTTSVTLADVWAMLKSENEDKAGDVLDNYARKVYRSPVIYMFDLVKDDFLKEFEKN